MHELPVTQSLEDAPVVIAPDGSTVRPLCHLSGLGSFCHRLDRSQYQRIGGANKPILARRQTPLLLMHRHRGFSAGIVHWVCPRGD